MRTSQTITCRSALKTASTLAAASAFPALAQAAWPSKPIRLLVPFAPGGSSEIVARSAANELSKTLGQSVFVENKPGAGGNIAMQECAQSTGGHTLILRHIGSFAVNPQASLAHVKSGKLRAIATGTKERLALLPDVPTVAEGGYPGFFEMTQWYGLNAPANMPNDVIAKIADTCTKAMKNPLATERLRGYTAQPAGDTPAQCAAFIKTEQARWKLVVTRAKTKAE